jgi:hypothetical protein
LTGFVQRHPWLVPVLAPFGLLVWATVSHRVLAPGDALVYYLPMHRLAAEALRSAHLPAWNQFQFGGSPLLATAQPAPFYPLEALFLMLPSFVANNFYVVCNESIAALGTFVFARRLTRDSAGACVAALSFASCGFMYGHLSQQSVVAAAAWLPWALNGLERLRERVDRWSVLALAAPLAASFLAGQPQISVLTVVALALYGMAVLVLSEPRLRTWLRLAASMLSLLVVVELIAPRALGVVIGALFAWVVVLLALAATAARVFIRRRPRAAFAAAAGLVIAVAAAAVQLVPVESIVAETSRASYSFADAATFSFRGSHTILLLFPEMFGPRSGYHGLFNLTELGAYPGVAALVLAVVGLPAWRRDRRFVALLVAAGFAMLAALGRSTSFGLVVWALPVLGHFRSWGRYAVVVDLAVAVGAAYGVSALRKHADLGVRRSVLAVGAIGAVGLIVPLLPNVAQYTTSGWARVYALVVPLAAGGAAVACVWLYRSRPRAGVVACSVLVVVDGLASFGLGSELPNSPTVGAASGLYSPSRAPAWGSVVAAPGGIARYLFLGTTTKVAEPNLPQATDLKGLRSANGYDPLAPSAYLKALGIRQDGASDRPGELLRRPGWMLDLLRVTTVLVPPSTLPRRISPRFTRIGVSAGLARFKFQPRLPDAFLVGSSRNASHMDAVARIRATGSFDPRRQALLEDCVGCPRLVGNGLSGFITRERRSPGRIALQVTARKRTALVVSEAWFPGWRASIDGRSVRVRRADGILLGVFVPPGSHRVVLHYVVPGVILGAAISSGTVVAIAVMALLALLSRRRAFGRRR